MKPEMKILKSAQEARAYSKEVEQAGYKAVRTTVNKGGIREHVVMVFRRK